MVELVAEVSTLRSDEDEVVWDDFVESFLIIMMVEESRVGHDVIGSTSNVVV
jgi:hypothetical protein